MDDIDILILKELQVNARISFKQLAQKVGLTAPAVSQRMRKLEKKGIVLGYRAVLSPAALGLPIMAVIRLSGGSHNLNFDDVAEDIPELLECHRVTGSEAHVMRAAVASTSHLEHLLERMWPYGDTVTNIVTSSPVPRRGIALPPPVPDSV